MTAFWAAAVALMAAALAWLLPPLLRGRPPRPAESRDSANARLYAGELAELDREYAQRNLTEREYRAAKLELERRLLEESAAAPAAKVLPTRAPQRRLALAVGALLPAAAVLLYLQVGNPGALDPQARSAAGDAAHNITPEQMEALVARLAQRLEKAPEDLDGWVMLARSYGALGRFEESARAFAHVTGRVQDNPDLLADYADALAMARGRKLAGEPYALVKRALKIDPRHFKSLALAGTAEFEAQNFTAAADFWQRSLAGVPPESEFARSIAASIDEARRLAGARPRAAPGARAPAASAAPAGTVSGTVRLARDLAGRVAPEDTVFVYARPEGARMPVALVRARAADLPYAFRLDDTTAMTPEMRLSKQSTVIIEARVSKSGNAVAQAGDLRGASTPVVPGASGLVLTIDQIVK